MNNERLAIEQAQWRQLKDLLALVREQGNAFQCARLPASVDSMDAFRA